jgi:hypothetical protein
MLPAASHAAILNRAFDADSQRGARHFLSPLFAGPKKRSTQDKAKY